MTIDASIMLFYMMFDVMTRNTNDRRALPIDRLSLIYYIAAFIGLYYCVYCICVYNVE